MSFEFDIERYLNVRNASRGTFGPDGEQLAFLLDTTGVTQLWSLEEPRGWPEQRTFYEERVTFADFSPTRDEIAFGMDEGGNERVQLFLIDDSETVTPLTGMPDAKHGWGGWSHDGDRFAFVSNRRDESVFDVYVQGRDPGEEATLIHEGSGWLSVAGWGPDDDRLIVHEAHASYDHDLYVLDIDTGDTEHLTPHEGDVRYRSPEWGPEGAIYVCTDEDAATLSLARLDLAGDLQTVVDGGDWNVDGVTVDQDSERLVYSRNVDGYTELHLAEFESPTDVRTFPNPDLPRGVAGGTAFGPDGERCAVTATGRSMNANVYVIDIESGETERWTNASTAGIPRETFVDPTLVHYESFDGLEVPAFFSLPHGSEDDDGDAGQPVIVDIHGGPESQRRPSFRAISQYFLNHGYAVFEPNVRGSSGYGTEYTHLDDVEKRMDSVKDLRAGVEWLHDHPAIDEDRIVALGGSYGGFMVLAALTEYPDLWAAGVDIVGIANFVTFLENTGDWRRSLREAEYGSLEDDRTFLEEISPINNIESIATPLFVAHGANDPRVPVGEAEQIATEAEKQGVSVETLVFEDEGHGFSKLDNRIEAYSRIVAFLDEHV